MTAGGDLGVALDYEQCAYLVGRIVLDLGLHHTFPEIPSDLAGFYTTPNLTELQLPGDDFGTCQCK